jgi:hypothetical protein
VDATKKFTENSDKHAFSNLGVEEHRDLCSCRESNPDTSIVHPAVLSELPSSLFKHSVHRELHIRLNMHRAATKMTKFANRIPPPAQVVGHVTAMSGVKNGL